MLSKSKIYAKNIKSKVVVENVGETRNIIVLLAHDSATTL